MRGSDPTPMLRVAIVEESRNDHDYQVIMTRETDTIMDILTHRRVNPETKNIFVNGRYVKEESLAKGLRTFGGIGTTIFITIKCKTVDRPRRASSK